MFKPVNNTAACRSGRPNRFIISILRGNRPVALERQQILCRGSNFLADNVAVFIDIMPVGALNSGVDIRTRPAAEGVAQPLRLVYVIDGLVLGVNRFYAVAALAEVKADCIIVAVIIEPEHSGAVGGDSVGLVEQRGKALDLYILKMIGEAAGFAEQILILRVEGLVGRIQVVIHVLQIVASSVMRQTRDIIDRVSHVIIKRIDIDGSRFSQRSAIRKRHGVSLALIEHHWVVTVDVGIRDRDVDRLTCGERRNVRIVRVGSVNIKIIDTDGMVRSRVNDYGRNNRTEQKQPQHSRIHYVLLKTQ